MVEQGWWVIGLVAVVITGVIAFFIGRQTGSSKERVDELEQALSREKATHEAYREQVDAHFDKTASLFVSMASSYKDLFEHLSSGYEHLAPGASRELFKDRVSALLLESHAAQSQPAVQPAESPAPALEVAGDAMVSAPEPIADAAAVPKPAQAPTPAPEGVVSAPAVDEPPAPAAETANAVAPAVALEKAATDTAVAPAESVGSGSAVPQEGEAASEPRSDTEAAAVAGPADSDAARIEDKKPAA